MLEEKEYINMIEKKFQKYMFEKIKVIKNKTYNSDKILNINKKYSCILKCNDEYLRVEAKTLEKLEEKINNQINAIAEINGIKRFLDCKKNIKIFKMLKEKIVNNDLEKYVIDWYVYANDGCMSFVEVYFSEEKLNSFYVVAFDYWSNDKELSINCCYLRKKEKSVENFIDVNKDFLELGTKLINMK